MESDFRLFDFKADKSCQSNFNIALIEEASFCDEARRAKDTADSGKKLPKNYRTGARNSP